MAYQLSIGCGCIGSPQKLDHTYEALLVGAVLALAERTAFSALFPPPSVATWGPAIHQPQIPGVQTKASPLEKSHLCWARTSHAQLLRRFCFQQTGENTEDLLSMFHENHSKPRNQWNPTAIARNGDGWWRNTLRWGTSSRQSSVQGSLCTALCQRSTLFRTLLGTFQVWMNKSIW